MSVNQDTPTAQSLIAYPNEGGFVYPATGDIPEFRDVLWLTPEEADTLTEDELQARMQERYDNFVLAVQPREPTPVTSELLDEQIADVDQQMRDLARQKLDLEDQKAALDASG